MLILFLIWSTTKYCPQKKLYCLFKKSRPILYFKLLYKFKTSWMYSIHLELYLSSFLSSLSLSFSPSLSLSYFFAVSFTFFFINVWFAYLLSLYLFLFLISQRSCYYKPHCPSVCLTCLKKHIIKLLPFLLKLSPLFYTMMSYAIFFPFHVPKLVFFWVENRDLHEFK